MQGRKLLKRTPAKVLEARRLRHHEGLSLTDIGRRLGVSGTSAATWIDPKYHGMVREQQRLNRRRLECLRLHLEPYGPLALQMMPI